MVRDPGFQRGRHSQGHVPTNEIIVEEMQRDGVFVVLDFLAESVRQSGEPSHSHSHRQVLAFDERRVDMVLIGVARLNVLFATDASRESSGPLALSRMGHPARRLCGARRNRPSYQTQGRWLQRML